jgi:hypothetical protein
MFVVSCASEVVSVSTVGGGVAGKVPLWGKVGPWLLLPEGVNLDLTEFMCGHQLVASPADESSVE